MWPTFSETCLNTQLAGLILVEPKERSRDFWRKILKAIITKLLQIYYNCDQATISSSGTSLETVILEAVQGERKPRTSFHAMENRRDAFTT